MQGNNSFKESNKVDLEQNGHAHVKIVQVYKGRLRSTGEVVAVKVQRPNISENIAIDMLLLRRFMTLVDARLPSLVDVRFSLP